MEKARREDICLWFFSYLLPSVPLDLSAACDVRARGCRAENGLGQGASWRPGHPVRLPSTGSVRQPAICAVTDLTAIYIQLRKHVQLPKRRTIRQTLGPRYKLNNLQRLAQVSGKTHHPPRVLFNFQKRRSFLPGILPKRITRTLD